MIDKNMIPGYPHRLDEALKAVPMERKPLMWDNRLTTASNLGSIQHYIHEYEKKYVPSGTRIDEAAIMVPPGEYYLDDIRLRLEQYGWELFNTSADLVHANPFGTRYVVEYTFFRKANTFWRLEVMQMGRGLQDGKRGFSPLHQALWENGETPTWTEQWQFPIPHLSFKPLHATGSKDNGRKAVRADLDYLRLRGGIIAQACQSTYGEFWYVLPNDALRQLYLKPRVNLRDLP